MASKRPSDTQDTSEKDIPQAEPVALPVEAETGPAGEPAAAVAGSGMRSSETNKWRVTELAGPRVAGRRVKAGDVLDLTDEEALVEETMGTIARAEKAEKAKG